MSYSQFSERYSLLPTPRECAFTLSFEKARGRTAPYSLLESELHRSFLLIRSSFIRCCLF
ncbi:MAG: hypothetical protein F6J94_23980 [Moorea sp. SIO1F2]|uniref:hypothetical protein n=1 Tax=unclassified Moorena TaxID=2683338 RepID=UPI0013BCFE88|nr:MULTISPECIES: hypothetical protein [unclassified Moorena]NEO09448.1 hypothetical protein [Moorena sp. SIO3I8]NEO23467.1 hypothetical protein [Moorena sp. SIO4A5]NEP26893.1 hypothetical protein [Moorena sp. SIO3I6]NEQ57152.1 hypothetical protein [Moorena sp. SIO4A1]NET84862.1 hypothetical protein [Moorena sp. SIO1F2]